MIQLEQMPLTGEVSDERVFDIERTFLPALDVGEVEMGAEVAAFRPRLDCGPGAVHLFLREAAQVGDGDADVTGQFLPHLMDVAQSRGDRVFQPVLYIQERAHDARWQSKSLRHLLVFHRLDAVQIVDAQQRVVPADVDAMKARALRLERPSMPAFRAGRTGQPRRIQMCFPTRIHIRAAVIRNHAPRHTRDRGDGNEKHDHDNARTSASPRGPTIGTPIAVQPTLTR